MAGTPDVIPAFDQAIPGEPVQGRTDNLRWITGLFNDRIQAASFLTGYMVIYRPVGILFSHATYRFPSRVHESFPSMTAKVIEVNRKGMIREDPSESMNIRTLAPVLVILVLLSIIPVHAIEPKNDDIPLIHVTGSGTIKAAPDRAEIELTVVTKNPDVKAAQKENARKMDTVMSALRDPSKGNLTGREIGTTSYSISEVYSPDDALKAKFGEEVTIYQVSNTISIETEKIDRVGDIIDIAVANGANSVSSLQFTLSQEKTAELRKQALSIAVKKAQTDAETVLSAMGKTVGDVYEITVDESYQPPVYYNQDYRSSQLAAAAPATPIEPGAVEVTARVTAGYLIA